MTNPETLILIQARALISDEEHWTQGIFAATASGRATLYNAPNADRWCAMGAIRKVSLGYEPNMLNPITMLDAAASEMFQTTMVGVNDCFGHKQVLEVYDLAIKKGEEG